MVEAFKFSYTLTVCMHMIKNLHDISLIMNVFKKVANLERVFTNSIIKKYNKKSYSQITKN